MADFFDLDGAFKSLTDTLQNRLSPFFDEEVSEHWLGAIGHASMIGRRVEAWNALPEELPEYDRLTRLLDRSARRLAGSSGGEDTAILSALAEVEAALGALEDLLTGSG